MTSASTDQRPEECLNVDVLPSQVNNRAGPPLSCRRHGAQRPRDPDTRTCYSASTSIKGLWRLIDGLDIASRHARHAPPGQQKNMGRQSNNTQPDNGPGSPIPDATQRNGLANGANQDIEMDLTLCHGSPGSLSSGSVHCSALSDIWTLSLYAHSAQLLQVDGFHRYNKAP